MGDARTAPGQCPGPRRGAPPDAGRPAARSVAHGELQAEQFGSTLPGDAIRRCRVGGDEHAGLRRHDGVIGQLEAARQQQPELPAAAGRVGAVQRRTGRQAMAPAR